jgi:hypothetical protein
LSDEAVLQVCKQIGVDRLIDDTRKVLTQANIHFPHETVVRDMFFAFVGAMDKDKGSRATSLYLASAFKQVLAAANVNMLALLSQPEVWLAKCLSSHNMLPYKLKYIFIKFIKIVTKRASSSYHTLAGDSHARMIHFPEIYFLTLVGSTL